MCRARAGAGAAERVAVERKGGNHSDSGPSGAKAQLGPHLPHDERSSHSAVAMLLQALGSLKAISAATNVNGSHQLSATTSVWQGQCQW